MNIEKLRRVWKKAMPFAFAAVVLGTAGTAIAHKYGGDCCSQGAACCKPGAPCCNGAHKIANR